MLRISCFLNHIFYLEKIIKYLTYLEKLKFLCAIFTLRNCYVIKRFEMQITFPQHTYTRFYYLGIQKKVHVLEHEVLCLKYFDSLNPMASTELLHHVRILEKRSRLGFMGKFQFFANI